MCGKGEMESSPIHTCFLREVRSPSGGHRIRGYLEAHSDQEMRAMTGMTFSSLTGAIYISSVAMLGYPTGGRKSTSGDVYSPQIDEGRSLLRSIL